MRLVIDTKHDSPEEIKHAINLLTALIGENIASDKPEAKNEDIFGNIFGAEEKESEQMTEEQAEEKEEIRIQLPGQEKDEQDEKGNDYLERVENFDIDELETY